MYSYDLNKCLNAFKLHSYALKMYSHTFKTIMYDCKCNLILSETFAYDRNTLICSQGAFLRS